MAKTRGGIRATRPANSVGNGDLGEKLQGTIISRYPEAMARKFAKMAGVPDNYPGEIRVSGDINGPRYTVAIRGDGLQMERVINLADKSIYNSYFRISNPDKKKYNGFEIFSDQVRIAAKNGIEKIKVNAAGYADPRSTMNGFYTWLRFGYVPNASSNAEYVNRFKDYVNTTNFEPRVKQRLLKVNNMTQFNDHKEALYWWQKIGGDGWDGAFNLQSGSYSRKQLAKYALERKKKK